MAKKKEPIKHILTEEDLKNNPDLAEKGLKVGDEIEIPAEEKEQAPQYKVHFGVEIPELKKVYTKEELEANPDVCEYLLEIKSGAVTKL